MTASAMWEIGMPVSGVSNWGNIAYSECGAFVLGCDFGVGTANVICCGAGGMVPFPVLLRVLYRCDLSTLGGGLSFFVGIVFVVTLGEDTVSLGEDSLLWSVVVDA